MLFVFFFKDVSYGMGPQLSGLSRWFIIIIPAMLVVFLAAPLLFFRLFVLPIYREDCGDSGFLASTMKEACCTFSPH